MLDDDPVKRLGASYHACWYLHAVLPEFGWIMAPRRTQRSKVPSSFVRRRSETRPIILGIVSLAQRTPKHGGGLTLSSPSSSSVWEHPDIVAFTQSFGMHRTTVTSERNDGKIMEMRYLCSSLWQTRGIASLGAKVREHPREEEAYDRLLEALCVDDWVVPAMSVQPVQPSAEYRERLVLP